MDLLCWPRLTLFGSKHEVDLRFMEFLLKSNSSTLESRGDQLNFVLLLVLS